MNLPDSNFLSAPLWLVTVLHVITLSLHFLAMNFLFGGILIVLRAGSVNRWQDPVVKKLVRIFPTAMAATVTLGIAPLLFLQLVFPRQVYSAAIVSGWLWLAVIPVVIVTYYALHRASLKGDDATAAKRSSLLLALLGMLYVSLVFSSVFSMAERPGLIHGLYAHDQSGFLLNPEAGDYFLRWLHMILGAATVGGFFAGLIGKDHPEAFASGRSLYLWGMVSASVAGIGYLIVLKPLLPAYMHTPGIWTLTAAIILSLGSLHFFFVKKFLPSGLMLFLSLIGMVTARHYVRLVKLQGQFDPASWRVAPQWSPFILFLICFVLMLAVLIYMLRLFFTAKQTEAQG
jgi:hypothetical protein